MTLSPRRDVSFIAVCAALLCLGLTILFSMAMERGEREVNFFARQLLFAVVIAGVAFPLLSMASLGAWRQKAHGLFFLACLLLLFTLLFGLEKNGAKRWLDLYVLRLQPVEFWKFSLLLLTARYLAGVVTAGQHTLRHFLPVALLIVSSFVFVGMQPDFGSLLLMGVIVAVMVFLAGLPMRWIVLLILLFIPLAWWGMTSADYRLRRLDSFMDPFADSYGSGYNQVHSLMAFAHGGWWGVGLGRSVEKFGLPEAHNDFIVAIIAEELGIVGFIVLCALFLFLVTRAVNIGRRAEERGDIFGALYSFGMAALFSLQVLINIGGSLSLLPSKGITLPLVSYGGSSLLATALMFSVLLRVDYENKTAGGVAND